MKTEVKYQPALDKQRNKPSITLSHAEQNTLTYVTWLPASLASENWNLFSQVCLNKDLDRNPLGYPISQTIFLSL